MYRQNKASNILLVLLDVSAYYDHMLHISYVVTSTDAQCGDDFLS